MRTLELGTGIYAGLLPIARLLRIPYGPAVLVITVVIEKLALIIFLIVTYVITLSHFLRILNLVNMLATPTTRKKWLGH